MDAEKSKIGQVHKISKLNNNALLIQIRAENHGRKLMQITCINKYILFRQRGHRDSDMSYKDIIT